MVHAFWVASVGFIAGVFSASFLSVPYSALLCAFLACAVLYVPRGFLVAVFLFACACGMWRLQLVSVPESVALNASVGEEVSIEGVVFEEPDIRERSTRLSVRLYGDVGVLVIAPLHVDVAYGDRIRAQGIVHLPESFDTGLSHSFNYPAFLAKDGIRYELVFAHVERVGDGEWNWFKGAAIAIKQWYVRGLSLALPEPQSGLASGITAGDKRGLGPEISDVFRTVGLTHIIVLSGYNIMIVIYGLSWIVGKLGAGRHAEFILGVCVALFLTLITGLASSSVRAAGMAIIGMLGKLLPGRTYVGTRALVFVACLMVLWNPYVLAFDPGFQLSVIATWGLMTVAPLVLRHFTFVTERFALREIAATTIGTQLSVLPLLLYQSGQLSIVALPANLLVLVAVPWAMLWSAIAACAGLVAGPLAPIIAFPAYVLLSYILAVAEMAARIPFALIAIGTLSPIIVIALYSGLVILVQSMQNGSQRQTN